MKAKRILDELLAKGQPLPDALISCFMEKHKINPVAELVKADRKQRFVRWLTFPILVAWIVLTSASSETRFRNGIVSGPESLLEMTLWAVAGCLLIRIGLPFVSTISYGDHNEERFFVDLAKVRGRLCPFPYDELWHDKIALREHAFRVLSGDAERVRIARAHSGELSEEARKDEQIMKEDCALFIFYNLLPQFESSKAAYKAAFERANQLPIPEKKEESRSGSV